MGKLGKPTVSQLFLLNKEQAIGRFQQFCQVNVTLRKEVDIPLVKFREIHS
jgi:hypothetical protein